MPRRRSYPSRSRASGRPTLWFNQATTPATVAPGGIANFDLIGAGVAGMPEVLDGGMTILRLILEVIVFNQVAGANAFGAYGIYVATAAVAVIQPVFDLLDYYVHQNFYSRDSDDSGSGMYRYDIRTARRLRGVDRKLRFTLENSAGSQNVTVRVNARMLVRPS